MIDLMQTAARAGADYSSEVPPINMEILLSRSMGKMSFALMLLSELETSLPGQVDEVVRNSVREDWNAAGSSAHTIKGAAAIIGAEELRTVAAAIELGGRTADAAAVRRLVPELQIAMNRCLDVIPQIRTTALASENI